MSIWGTPSAGADPFAAYPSTKVYNPDTSRYGSGISRTVRSTAPGGASAGATTLGAGGGLYADWQKAFDEAKAANEQRYGELKTGYDQLEAQAMGYLEGMGETERADIGRRWLATGTSGVQDLVSRGLGNSSLRYDIGRAVTEGEGRDVGALQERLNQQYLGTLQGVRGAKLGMIERREDMYPDYGLLAQLMGQYGQGMAGMTGPTGGGRSTISAGAVGGPMDVSQWIGYGNQQARPAAPSAPTAWGVPSVEPVNDMAIDWGTAPTEGESYDWSWNPVSGQTTPEYMSPVDLYGSQWDEEYAGEDYPYSDFNYNPWS